MLTRARFETPRFSGNANDDIALLARAIREYFAALDAPGSLEVSDARIATTNVIFPATQVPSSDANTLDDYEEGTWTPSIGGSATYTTQTGTYTKIGRLVYVNMVFTINVIGTGSTTVISGLPFTAANDTTFVVRETGSATSTVFVVGSLSASGTTITLLSKTAAATAASANAIFANGATVRLSGSYEV